MQRTAPPFRADHVGSLLRPPALKEAREEARAQRDHGRCAARGRRPRDRAGDQKTGRDRTEARDRRRISPHLVAIRFLCGLDGVELYDSPTRHPVSRRADQGARAPDRRQGRFLGHPMSRISGFCEATRACAPKMTIPAPSMLHFRQGRQSSARHLSRSGRFLRRRATAYRGAIRAFYDAGCRYLQLDDTAWAMVCDPSERAHSQGARRRARKLPQRLRAPDQRGARRQAGRHGRHLAFLPRQFPLHLDRRGRLRVRRRALFGRTGLDGYFLEYDTDRAGGFEPLRFFPKGKKQLVLGLVTSKSGVLEKKDDISAASTRPPNMSPRSVLPVAAMRFRLDRGGQCSFRGRAMGEAAHGVELPRKFWRRSGPTSFGERKRRMTMERRTKPPFRADHVGSLLRPAPLKEAREKRHAPARSPPRRSRRSRIARSTRDPQAGRGRAQVGHRRRVSPRLHGITISSNSSMASNPMTASARSSSPQGPQPRVDAAARHRQAWRLRAASDDRAFQVPQSAHQADGRR